MAPPIRTRPSFPVSQSLPAGSFHKPLIHLDQRADRLKNHNYRKLSNLITWTIALSNSMKLWAMTYTATQMGHGRDFWQNIVHWRREWQATSVFFPWECHEQFSSVQSLSCVWLFVTPWTTAHQASLSITNSRSLPKPMSIKLVMPSNHLILCCPLLLLPSIFPSIRVFSNESALHIRWRKYFTAIETMLQNFRSLVQGHTLVSGGARTGTQGDNIQYTWHIPFPIWNQSALTVSSWPDTDFSRGRSGGLIFPSL